MPTIHHIDGTKLSDNDIDDSYDPLGDVHNGAKLAVSPTNRPNMARTIDLSELMRQTYP